MTAVVIMAKECLPGRVKTRLSPPYSLTDAARIAAASLADTLSFVADLPVNRRILAFDGQSAPDAPGFEVIAQTDGGLDERIAAVLDTTGEPTLVVGMDTPQLRRADIAPALIGLGTPDPVADAWLGPATDGGFWALGIHRPCGELVRGVPMSRTDTGARQRARLDAAGLRIGSLAPMTDLDDVESLAVVLDLARPGGRLHGLFSGSDAPRTSTIGAS